jgi:hypothetical protein
MVLGAMFLLSSFAFADEPGEVLREAQAAALDATRAVQVRNVTLELGPAELRLENGLLAPSAAVAGRSVELAFFGQGRFRIAPAEAVESRQLELFTGAPRLDVAIGRVVLVIGDEATTAAVLERPTVALDDTQREALEGLLSEWHRSIERKQLGADAAATMALLHDPALQSYRAAWCHSEDLGTFFYRVDPTDTEQVKLGQFVPLELDVVERHQIHRLLRRERRRGRFLTFDLADLGDWDTWVSTTLRTEAGAPLPGAPGFEPDSYTIDLQIGAPDPRASGSATVVLDSRTGLRRFATFALAPDLRVQAVRAGDSRALFWFVSRGALHVMLPEPLAIGARTTIRISYEGQILESIEPGTFVLRYTDGWYPRIGAVDRARYDVTLHWPGKHDLLASGRAVESTRVDGMRHERRVLDLPADEFSFEIGTFDVRRERLGHIELEFGFSKTTYRSLTERDKQHVVRTVQQSLGFFEERFGAYPLDYLTVVTVPREWSQGFLGFVTLAHDHLRPNLSLLDLLRLRAPRTELTIAHELAHQWWGNKVGWVGYRDQWLSEALAEYSALSYRANSRTPPAVTGRAWGFGSLLDETPDGRTLESLGPVVLGGRLVSSRSHEAYAAVTYEKGRAVLEMLATQLGENVFTGTLRALSILFDNRVVDTDEFLRSVERFSRHDLGDFAERFVYGTGIPEIHYSYDIRQEGKGWSIRGEAREVHRPPMRFRLAPTNRGTWRLDRTRLRLANRPSGSLRVPFQAPLARKEGDLSRYLIGHVVLEGQPATFAIDVDEEPTGLILDREQRMLASFVAETLTPKLALVHRAMEQDAGGAEPLYREALDADLYSGMLIEAREYDAQSIARATQIENARIRLELARLYLDLDRTADAVRELEAAEAEIAPHGATQWSGLRDSVRRRLEVQRGEYKTAYEHLSRALRLRFPRTDAETVGSARLRKKFRTGRTGDGEDYALLAVAAFEVGRELVSRTAMDEAERRGADMQALRDRLP